jgi:hypothetical protein
MEFTLDAEGSMTGFIESAGLERYTFRRVGR